MLLILFLIITCAQYIIAWAAYAEKRYTAESIFGSKLKKLQKKNKTNIQMDTIINTIPLPSIFVRNFQSTFTSISKICY